MNIAIVLEPPRGRRWRSIIRRFGGDPRLGIVTSEDIRRVRTASFIIERMRGATLVLINGSCLSLLALDISSQRIFEKDILIRCVKSFGLPLSRRLASLSLALLLFPSRDGATAFLNSNRIALARCCRPRFSATVSPCRRIDAERIRTTSLLFSRYWGSRALAKAGIRDDEYAAAWSDALERCLE
ncbi:MAG: hypothetical protein GXO32_06110 [Crenarchaeota archaeon]|nr:hypothetical protein [Thermoproteota archaeon]